MPRLLVLVLCLAALAPVGGARADCAGHAAAADAALMDHDGMAHATMDHGTPADARADADCDCGCACAAAHACQMSPALALPGAQVVVPSRAGPRLAGRDDRTVGATAHAPPLRPPALRA